MLLCSQRISRISDPIFQRRFFKIFKVDIYKNILKATQETDFKANPFFWLPLLEQEKPTQEFGFKVLKNLAVHTVNRAMSLVFETQLILVI